MLWLTLKGAQQQTACEFAPWLAQRHHFLRLLSGRWTRTLGPPSVVEDAVGRPIRAMHVHGRVWRQQLPV